MIKKSTIILIGIELFLSMMFLINIFVININNMYIISSFLMLNILLVICLLGYEKNRQRLKKDAFLSAVIFSSLLQVILYLSGLFLGFLNNAYNITILGIIKNVVPLLILIVTSEILRYCINQKGRESKIVLVMSCITFIIIECCIGAMLYDFTDKKIIVEIVCLLILPSITKNIFLTYNTTKFGFESSIIYRLIVELPIYFIPILPNIGDYLNSIIHFLYPILVLVITRKTLGKQTVQEEIVYKKINKIPLFIVITFLTILIVLNTRLAPLYVIAVGSGSMETSIYRGDVVIVKKVAKNNLEKLQVGDILVYNYHNRVIVHRIYTIKENNGDIQIRTKGDNNEKPDAWLVNKNDISGTVLFPIKYIGWPTLWLNELLS